MRVALLLALLSSVAVAGTRVVVMTDAARADALQVALAGRRVDVATQQSSPDGALLLDRAAVVQRAALAADADAGIWIDLDATGAEVCVVSADGRYLRHAPLPSNAMPRVFAAIATSLLDELLAPPEGGPQVSVDVHVDMQPGVVAPDALPVAAFAPPAAATELEPPRWRRTLVEIGPTISTASVGLEAEIAFPVTRSLRVGAFGGVSHLFDGFADEVSGSALYDGGLELRYVGRGTTHFDIGVAGGLASAIDDNMERDTGGFFALRLSAVREYERTAVSLSLSPMVLFDFLGQANQSSFGLMGSLRIEIPI
jgi:hypothetical protein